MALITRKEGWKFVLEMFEGLLPGGQGIKMSSSAVPLDGERDEWNISNKNNVIMEQFSTL